MYMRLTTEEKVCMALRHRDVLDFGPKLTHSLNARLKVLKVPCDCIYIQCISTIYVQCIFYMRSTKNPNIESIQYNII